MTNENPFTLEWVAETFKSHIEKGCVADPEYFMRGLLEARAAYEQALQNERFRKTCVLGRPLSGGCMPCGSNKED